MTPPPAPVAINPYHKDDLIYVMTTPPERSSKLAPRWKGPFFVKRVPNAYQVTYEDDMVWRTVTLTMLSQPKPRLKASPSLCLHLNHHCLPCAPPEEYTTEAASKTSSTSRSYHGVASTSRPCRRAHPASRRATRRHASTESTHHTLISQSEIGPSL